MYVLKFLIIMYLVYMYINLLFFILYNVKKCDYTDYLNKKIMTKKYNKTCVATL